MNENYHFTIPNTNEKLVAKSLIDICQFRAKYQADKIAFRFLNNGINESETLSYSQLDQAARKIAVSIQSKFENCTSVVLLYPPGLNYIKAFFACLYAQVIAIPAYPVMSPVDGKRLNGIINDAKPSIILTASEHLSSVKEWLNQEKLPQTIPCTSIEEILVTYGNKIPVNEQEQNIAFLQYTSGSTGDPKGVVISHTNLLHNLQQIYFGFGHHKNSVGVIWLPPYHDMGLIGGILQPLYGGFEVNLMSPFTFVRRPIRWLQAISHYKATTSGGPNFAYEACLKYATAKNLETLDLTSWKVAFIGAEKIQLSTLNKFAQYYQSSGFNKTAYYPCYGLAESSLMVTGSKLGQGAKLKSLDLNVIKQDPLLKFFSMNNHKMVSCGKPYDAELKIVNTNSLKIMPDKRAGEIWVKSLSVAEKYWQKPKLSKEVFQAYTFCQQGPYLRTGDLGYLENGELIILGRIKEMIIINGQNYYPYDIENIIQSNEQVLKKDHGTVFSVIVDELEQLIVIQELNHKVKIKDQQEIINSIKKIIHTHYKIIPYEIILVKKSALPKTTSGKLKRLEVKKNYLNKKYKNEQEEKNQPLPVVSM